MTLEAGAVDQVRGARFSIRTGLVRVLVVARATDHRVDFTRDSVFLHPPCDFSSAAIAAPGVGLVNTVA